MFRGGNVSFREGISFYRIFSISLKLSSPRMPAYNAGKTCRSVSPTHELLIHQFPIFPKTIKKTRTVCFKNSELHIFKCILYYINIISFPTPFPFLSLLNPSLHQKKPPLHRRNKKNNIRCQVTQCAKKAKRHNGRTSVSSRPQPKG